MKHFALAVTFLSLLGSAAQAGAEDYVRGQIAGPIACASDKTATYAYYLPAGYTDARKWPVLFVFDPRSRGALAAELFRQAAEDYGWIVVSSNNTMSDTDPAPSVRAITAMTGDVPKRFAVDARRIYAAGFSGGAMYAWALARSAPIAGVIGCSGRPIGPHDADGVKFDWFGTAGTLDFNESETRAIERSLERTSAAHRTEYFAGPHRWAPVEVLRRAVEWMELQAMKRGTRPRDDILVERLLRDDLARAGAEPDSLMKQRHFEAVARTFDGLTGIDGARKRAEELRDSAEVRKLEKEERDAESYEQKYRSRMMSVFRQITSGSAETPSVPWLSHALGIPGLLATAKEPSYRGVAAARVLETMYSNLHFYLARDFRANGQGERLDVVLAVAAQIHPADAKPDPRR